MAELIKKDQDKKEAKPVEGQLVSRDTAQLARHPLQLVRELARDPFAVMRDLMRWDPFRELTPLFSGHAWSPDFEVRETKESYIIKGDLPGTKQDDLEVSLVGNRLQISGKREEEQETKEDTYFALERGYGSFRRIFTLPDIADTEHITSDLRDGVLTLVVPKKAESKARKIPIGSREKH
jgi:HSP20 family protein